jgi:hypothetical protein
MGEGRNNAGPGPDRAAFLAFAIAAIIEPGSGASSGSIVLAPAPEAEAEAATGSVGCAKGIATAGPGKLPGAETTVLIQASTSDVFEDETLDTIRRGRIKANVGNERTSQYPAV